MQTSWHLHMKSSEVCIKTRSPPASFPIQGQVAKHTTVKWLIEFNVSWKAETSSFVMIQKLSSTYRFQILGGRDELLIADSSISSMQRLATTGLTGLPIAQPWTCL